MKPAIFCFALTVLVLTGCSRQRIPMTSISPDFRNYHIDWDTSEYIPSPAMLPQITYTPPVVHDSLWCYEQAFKELKAMLTGDTLLSFKRAVFITENAYLNNWIDYEVFNKAIAYETALCSSIKSYSRLKNYHHWKDSAKIETNEAIFSLMNKPIVLSKDMPLTISTPFTYNFSDCFGDSDWTNTFVLKTLITHKGNCRSLTFLYKILTDELGTQSSLALAPNHIYVKQRSDKLVMYNTELTSGLNPIDGWIMAANYISLESVQKGVYMKALTDKQNLAVCLLDLAEGYKHKFKNDTARFILKCADLALKYNPKYIDALQLKGRTWKKIYDRTKSKTAYKKMDSAYVAIMNFGYQEMPEWQYQQWLAEMDKEKEKYTPIEQERLKYPSGNFYFGYDNEQEAITHNPYKSLGLKPPKVLTLSDGKYEEFFDYNELVLIDNVVISRKKNKVVQFAFDKKLRPEGITRWMSPDPLAQNFPSVSPYMAWG